MEIVDIAVKDLVPYDKNPRRNDEAAVKVAESIKQFGFKIPLVVDRNNVVVCGHTRLKAAKKLKLKTVPCILADDLSEDQIKAFRLVDNRTAETVDLTVEAVNPQGGRRVFTSRDYPEFVITDPAAVVYLGDLKLSVAAD